jgi:hypothetical protein
MQISRPGFITVLVLETYGSRSLRLLAIANATVVLTPSHFARIGRQVRPGVLTHPAINAL